MLGLVYFELCEEWRRRAKKMITQVQNIMTMVKNVNTRKNNKIWGFRVDSLKSIVT